MDPFYQTYLIPLAVSLIAHQIDNKVVNPIEKFILNFPKKEGTLPANHHLERGTYRAAVLASYLCIKKVQPSFELRHPRDVEIDDYRYYGARDQLLLRLKRLEQDLRPRSQEGFFSKFLKKREKALTECTVLFEHTIEQSLAPNLDSAGMGAFALQNARDKEVKSDKSRDFTALRSLWTPNLAEKLCKILATWGGWPKERHSEIADIFNKTFFGSNELWLNSFAYFYIEEIRQDPKLYVTATMLRAENAQQALERIEEGNNAARDDAQLLAKDLEESFSHIRSFVNEINDNLEEIIKILHRIQEKSSLGSRRIFFPPSGGDNDFKPFHFSEEEEEFVGRDSLLEWLKKEVLEIDVPFAWTAISGPAGMGKSRLAFHVINEYLTHFRHSGFVSESAIAGPFKALPSSEDIDGPTLLVIDYAGSAPENSAEFLLRCALVAEGASYPVRVLVLVRRSDDEFFSQVENGREYGPLRETRIKSDHPASQNGEVVLEPLDENNILDLMRSRMASTAELQATEEGLANKAVRPMKDDELVKVLQQYGADEGRPLYALLIADGLQRGLEVLRSEGETVEEARLRLLWDYLLGQYHRRWKPTSRLNSPTNDIADEKLDRHLTFAVLSTFCRGLTDKAWKRLVEDDILGSDAQVLLPTHRRHRNGVGPGTSMDDRRLLPSIVGTRRSDKNVAFPGIEPDLIGEALLLGLLQDIKKQWCEIDETAEDRRDFLVELAWHADPDGAAYFANLVAQDFPKMAEKAGWLLPKTPRKEHEVPRARLIKNLASIILSRFSDTAATMEDVRLLDRLIRLFDFREDVDEEAIAKYAQAYVAIAEELSFVINKSIVPTTRLQAEPMLDPKKSERLRKFEEVSSLSGPFKTSDERETVAGPQDILGRKSDRETVELTMRVLRRMFRIIPNYIARDYGFDIRSELFATIGWAMTSVFWENRNDESKFGYAPTELSDRERKERSDFLSAIEALVPTQEPDQATIGLVANMLYAALFAEAGTVVNRGDKIYCLINDLATTGTFTHIGALSKSIRFLRNYITIQNKRDIGSHSFGEEHAKQVRNCIGNLFEQSISLKDVVAKDWKNIVNSFFTSIFFEILEKETLSGDELDLQPAMHKFLAFCDSHGFHKVGGEVVEFMAYFTASSIIDDEAKLPLLQRFLELVEETGFNRQSLNNPFWTNINWCLQQLMRSSPAVWPIARAIIERLVLDVGIRAKESLQQILNNVEALDNIAVEHFTDLVALIEATLLDETEIRLRIFARALLDDKNEYLMAQLGHWRTEKNSEEEIKQRTFALQILMLLLPWRGAEDPAFTDYRTFLLEAFQNESEKKLDGVSETVLHTYRSTITDAVIMFVELEVASGAMPDIWIEAVRKN